MAERVGFEPTVRFPARTLSRRVTSTTHPPLHSYKPYRVFLYKCELKSQGENRRTFAIASLTMKNPGVFIVLILAGSLLLSSHSQGTIRARIYQSICDYLLGRSGDFLNPSHGDSVVQNANVTYSRWFQGQLNRYDLNQLRIEGSIPHDIRGTLYRVGHGVRFDHQ